MPINPTREHLAEHSAVAGSEADGPVVMLNLNRYRPAAAYEARPAGGVDPGVTGREAYARYLEVAQRVLAREGGRVVWHATSPGTVVGEPVDRYDEIIAVYYPSLAAFLALALDPEIMEALTHRSAGLERAALIRCSADDVAAT